jgi:Mg-chelatase subunit ChlD
MNFLAPIFFLALGAIAVPVIIHLIQRERKEPLRFPSLMFLRQVPYKSTKRRKIRNWPLFVLRCLAILLLAAAFARPYLNRDVAAAGALSDAREVVIMVDRSYSMGYGDRWARAVAAAEQVMDGIRPDDRATLVLFDQSAAGVNQATSDRLALYAALQDAEPGSSGTRYAPVLKLAQSILESSDRPRLEAVLVSDFQRAGWEGDPGARLPAGATLTPIAITDETVANVSVTGVAFRREDVGGRERVTPIARLANRSDAPAEDVRVTLELGGRQLEEKTVTIPANNAAPLEFAPFTLVERNQRGTIRAADDKLLADNAFHFVLSPDQAVSVLIVEGGSAESSLYLREALALGEEPGFRVETRRSGELRAGDVAGRAVVVLNDVSFPTGDLGRRLRTFVERGGGLILALGERAGTGGSDAAEVLPGTPGRTTDRTGDGASLGYIDYSHPVFELFRGPRSGDFTAARFFWYRPVEPPPDARVLARFDDGTPALVERRVGEGRVLLVATTLDTYWNNLALQPVFLPFVHQMMKYAAGYSQASPWFTAGQVLDFARWGDTGPAAGDTAVASEEAPPVTAASDYVALAPSGDRVTLGDDRLLRLDEQGFYSIRAARGGDERDFAVAVNVDLAESELSTVDPQELASAVVNRNPGAERNAFAGIVTSEDRERRQSLWWYVLAALFVLLAGETVWSNRISGWRRRTT